VRAAGAAATGRRREPADDKLVRGRWVITGAGEEDARQRTGPRRGSQRRPGAAGVRKRRKDDVQPVLDSTQVLYRRANLLIVLRV